MAGKHFCVSYSDHRDDDVCQRIGQSCMWDNGAFSQHTKGKGTDWNGFYKWVEPRLGHPNWAVIPDVIGGDVEANEKLIQQWPFRRDIAAPVWHMDEPIEVLLDFTQRFNKVCFGSAAQYWQVGSASWCQRADEAFNALAARGPIPWVHMLRGTAMCGKRWPFASVDSANVARHHADRYQCPEAMARVIDAVQCPVKWMPLPSKQETLF